MTVTEIGNDVYIGLSSDTKPSSGIPAGSRFIETDTGMLWTYMTTATGFAWTTGKYAVPTPNIMRIGVFDGGTASNMASWGVVGVNSGARVVTGSGASNLTHATSTEGQAMNASTGTTSGSGSGFGQGNAFIVTAAQLYFRFRFRVNQSTTNNRLWIGPSGLAAASLISDTPLNNTSGLFFGFAAGATNFTVIQNNGGASQYDNLVSTPSFPVNAVDTNWHTVELYTIDNGTNFKYTFDGSTPFNLSTTQLLGSGNAYTFLGIMSNTTTTSFNWDIQYCWMSMSPNNK